MTDAPRVHDNIALHRYELETADGVAFLDYRRRDGIIVLVHTQVPEPLRGRNLASILARHALDAARAEGRRVVVRCPFVAAWVRRHPDYEDIIGGNLPGAGGSAPSSD